MWNFLITLFPHHVRSAAKSHRSLTVHINSSRPGFGEGGEDMDVDVEGLRDFEIERVSDVIVICLCLSNASLT